MKNVKFIFSFLLIAVILSGSQFYRPNQMTKAYSSSDKRFKFKFLYPSRGWLLVEDIKQTRLSRFKDLAVLKTQNRVNQLRIATYKGLTSPDAKRVARLLEAEFTQQEIKHGEQYFKVRDVKMSRAMARRANANEGWILSLSYYDRREGTLYSTYYIYYRKVVLPSEKRGKPAMVIGKAYIIRTLMREKDYKRLIKGVLKVVRSFKFVLRR